MAIKPPGSRHQQRKPYTKVMTYMAAGLPVVCTPSPADRMLLEHGRSGFFAETLDEWCGYLTLLVRDDALREKMGRAARERAMQLCSLQRIAGQYVHLFDELIHRPMEKGRR